MPKRCLLKMAPNFGPETVQNGAKKLQNDPKTIKNGSNTVQNGSKRKKRLVFLKHLHGTAVASQRVQKSHLLLEPSLANRR